MIKFFYPLLLLLLFWQCHDEGLTTTETTSAPVPFRQEFILQAGDQVQLSDTHSSGKLHLTLQSLNDSRCPANVMCVQYGSATAMLLAKDNLGKNQQLEFCIGSCGGNPIRDTHTLTTQSGNVTYSITLKEVQPFPGLEQKGDVKKVVLVVEKEI